MARFLVTGGAGFIGSHLVPALIDEGHAVRVIDDLSVGHRESLPWNIEFLRADVTNPNEVKLAFEGIDGCYHLAAIASVVRSHSEWVHTHRVNLTGTINIFDQARCSAKRPPVPVVYASTAAVYGDGGAIPMGEDRPPAPMSAYGADKYACELHARVAGAVHNIPTVGLRFFNLYGARRDPKSAYSGVISIFTDRLLSGAPVEIFGDGEQSRDFTYVDDAIIALRLAMPVAATSAPVFNVCTGQGTSVNGLAATLAKLCGAELVVNRRPVRGGEVRMSIGDPRCADEMLNFRAQTPLSDGLAVTLEAFRHATAPQN